MAKLLWTQRQDIGPAARSGGAAAFDPVRARTVLFGGAFDRGTWEWDGHYWTQVSDLGPGPRRDFGMAWDSVSKAVVLFGGSVVDPMAAAGDPVTLADTWSWNGEDWTQVEDAGPSPRFAFGMASDTSRNRVVLFGGAHVTGGVPQAFGDTWEWDGEAWTQQEETGPAPRSGQRLAFDSVRGRTVLFGGVPVTGAGQNDTWEWNGTAWIRVSEFGPVRRFAAGMCFDGAQTVLFGGRDTASILGDTWSWDGKFWTQRQDIGPAARSGHAMAFDEARKRSVLFGGSSTAAPGLADTWELAG